MQRADLNPIEIAEAFDRLIKEYSYTQQTLAERVGKDRVTVTNALRLLKLPPRIRTMVIGRELSEGHARALLGAPSDKAMADIADKTVRGKLPVRKVEQLVRSAKARESGAPAPTRGQKARPAASPAIRDLEARLQRRLGTRVEVRDQGGKGELVVAYGSLDELDRVLGDPRGAEPVLRRCSSALPWRAVGSTSRGSPRSRSMLASLPPSPPTLIAVKSTPPWAARARWARWPRPSPRSFDYYLVRGASSASRRLERVRRHPLFERAERWAKVAPFLTIVVFAAVPLPFLILRVLMPAHRLPARRATSAATALGRFPRIFVIATFGTVVRDPHRGSSIGLFVGRRRCSRVLARDRAPPRPDRRGAPPRARAEPTSSFFLVSSSNFSLRGLADGPVAAELHGLLQLDRGLEPLLLRRGARAPGSSARPRTSGRPSRPPRSPFWAPSSSLSSCLQVPRRTYHSASVALILMARSKARTQSP